MIDVDILCWKCGRKFKYEPDNVEIVKFTVVESEEKAEETREIIVDKCPSCQTMNRIEIEPNNGAGHIVVQGRNPSGSDDERIKIEIEPNSGAGHIVVQGRNPSGSDDELIKAGKEYFTASPASLNTIAKDLVALNSALITAYIAALTFLKIPETGILSPSQSLVWAALPILFWFLSILFSAYARYQPLNARAPGKEEFDLKSQSSIKKGLNKIISWKSNRITAGYVLLAAGLLTGAIFLVGGNYSSTTISDVQFVVREEYISTFENMSMIEDNKTTITVPVTLIGESDTSYTVRKDSGEIILFNKDQVVGIKYQVEDGG